MTDRQDRHRSPRPAPEARRRPPQLREAGRRRARGLRRGRARRVARGHRRRAGVGIGTLYRHFPTRQHLLEAVYVDEVEAICRSADDLRGPAAVGRARRLAAPSSSATPPPSARSPRSCSPTSTATPRSSASCARRRSRRRRARCSQRAQAAGDVRPDADFADIGRMVGGIAAIRGERARADRAHPRRRARRPALPAAERLTPSARGPLR